MKVNKTLRKYDLSSWIVIALYALCVLFVVWIFASYINVILHNNTDRIYWAINFFKLLAN